MVAILSRQREAILDAVRTMYTEVASHPERGFHFPTGRQACEFVGYPADVLDRIPEGAVESFAGVGYPFAVGVMRQGDRVLDIGSGAGTDSLLAARIVGSTGRVHSLDITPAMLEKLGENARTAGVLDIVEPLEGSGESIPLPSASVDVVTSNGVLNLMPDKRRCISEIHRVLVPGGYLQLADIVLGEPASDKCRMDPALWAECIVGATLESEYLRWFKDAGFECGVLGALDYFSASSSAATRKLASSLGGRSIVLWAVKKPIGTRRHEASDWPPPTSPDVDSTDPGT